MILTKEETGHIIAMCKSDIEDGKRVMLENQDAEILYELWREALKLDKSIIYKLGGDKQ